MKVFISWSGGKDSALACYRAMQNPEMQVAYFLNMLDETGVRSRSHGLNPELLQQQAKAAGVPMMQRSASWNNYEKEFKKALLDLKKEGVEAGVFGDIDLQAHRDWVERVCGEVGLRAILPLWNENRRKLIDELIGAGFKAKICVTDAKYMDESWLGCDIDAEFIRKAEAAGNIDLCGEKGEYHTFVYDGPIFREPVHFDCEDKIFISNHWALKIVPAKLEIVN